LNDRLSTWRKGHSPFFARVAAREEARIVHIHGGNMAMTVAGSALRAGLPFIVSFYGVDMWKHPAGAEGLKKKYRDVFASGRLFIVEGPAAASQLEAIGCNPDRIVINRLGVDVAAIPFHQRSVSSGGNLRVLMAARFTEKKGIPYGVEGFCRVAKLNPGMRLTIVGDSGSRRDERARAEILAIVGAHGVAGQVDVRPFMPLRELEALASEHDVLLHPSVTARSGDSEGGHPVVMTLFAATGMPIIATRHCDIPEVVEDGRTGWLVAERNAKALAQVFSNIVDDASCIASMSVAARKLVESKYDIRRLRLDSVYDRCLA
jgi:colanic acid/amylovoran biosynthesis glycosyltransferase